MTSLSPMMDDVRNGGYKIQCHFLQTELTFFKAIMYQQLFHAEMMMQHSVAVFQVCTRLLLASYCFLA
jgi:hypothetical protein